MQIKKSLPLILLLSFSISSATARNLVTKVFQRLCGPAIRNISPIPQEERWQVDGPLADYSYSFQMLLNAEGITPDKYYFDNLLAQRKRKGLKTNFMDLFGSGFNIHNRTVADSILGVRKGPIKLDPKEIAAGVTVPQQVFGDLMDPKTWQYIDNHLKKNKIPSLDLITMVPEGGWRRVASSTEENVKAICYIAEHSINRLSATGEFYFSLDHINSPKPLDEEPQFQALMQRLSKLKPPKEIIIAQRRSSSRNEFFLTEAWIRPKQ